MTIRHFGRARRPAITLEMEMRPMATTSAADFTPAQIQIIINAVEYHTTGAPHLAHLSHYWLPQEAYDHDYCNAKGVSVSRSRAMTKAVDGYSDEKPGYFHHRHINDLGRAMIAEHERLLREIDSPGYHKIVAEQGR